jgi:hypothetical protein
VVLLLIFDSLAVERVADKDRPRRGDLACAGAFIRAAHKPRATVPPSVRSSTGGTAATPRAKRD